MQLGIFAKIFARAAIEQVFDAVREHGLDCVQFNFSCAGLPTLPESFDAALLERIRAALKTSSLSMAAVSGTCNLIHPDPVQRAKDVRNLQKLIEVCATLGTPVVTLCTGSRDPSDMWRAHRGNHLPDAWRDLLRSLEQLLVVAQEGHVFLGIEPEPSNVVHTAAAARKLLDELKSPVLKIVFDAANLLQPHTLEQQGQIIAESIDLLGPDTVLAHAKDLTPGAAGRHVAAGQGALDYELYLSLLQKAGFRGALILHNLREEEVDDAIAFLIRRGARPSARGNSKTRRLTK